MNNLNKGLVIGNLGLLQLNTERLSIYRICFSNVILEGEIAIRKVVLRLFRLRVLFGY